MSTTRKYARAYHAADKRRGPGAPASVECSQVPTTSAQWLIVDPVLIFFSGVRAYGLPAANPASGDRWPSKVTARLESSIS